MQRSRGGEGTYRPYTFSWLPRLPLYKLPCTICEANFSWSCPGYHIPMQIVCCGTMSIGCHRHHTNTSTGQSTTTSPDIAVMMPAASCMLTGSFWKACHGFAGGLASLLVISWSSKRQLCVLVVAACSTGFLRYASGGLFFIVATQYNEPGLTAPGALEKSCAWRMSKNLPLFSVCIRPIPPPS